MSARRTLSIALAALLTVVAGQACHAATLQMPVFVQSQSGDTAGDALVYALRERLAASREFALSDTERAAVFQLRIVTEDPGEVSPGHVSTVYSMVLTMHNPGREINLPLFLDTWVGTCTGSNADSCAKSVFASAAADMTRVSDILRAAASASSPGKGEP